MAGLWLLVIVLAQPQVAPLSEWPNAVGGLAETAEGELSSLQVPPVSKWLLRRAEKIEEQNGQRRMRLWYEAQADLAGGSFLHYQVVEGRFDQQGRPLEPLKIAPPKKSELENIEGLLPVRRFAERYGPLRVFHPAQAGGHILLLGQTRDRRQPELVLLLRPERLDAVERYLLPGIQGFPGRRELLRFAQALSQHHPACRAVQIEGRRSNPTPPVQPGQNSHDSGQMPRNCRRYPLGNCLESEFLLEGRLQGAGCPERFAVKVDQFLVTTVLP